MNTSLPPFSFRPLRPEEGPQGELIPNDVLEGAHVIVGRGLFVVNGGSEDDIRTIEAATRVIARIAKKKSK
jgi:hypothetical protein